MEHRISATDLARNLGDVLGRIRYLNDSFVVERNGEPVARILPFPGSGPVTVREALSAWGESDPDPAFAHDLKRSREERPSVKDPWGS